MCGIVALFNCGDPDARLGRMTECLLHRGPDGNGTWVDRHARVALGHTRLSIVDLSQAGAQPMATADGSLTITFNGELYNHVELRAELSDFPFRSRTDTEVVLAAWLKWGPACLARFIGMFAFVIWDRRDATLTAVRDRFGVKPLLYARLADGAIAVASEIKALRLAGADTSPDPIAWASYLVHGVSDQGTRTFAKGVESLPAGTLMRWQLGREPVVERWYDLAHCVGETIDDRVDSVVRDEYAALLTDAVRLRFRADVPIGINLSGGLDSSALLGLVHAVDGPDSLVKAFTFSTGDAQYDELPWVQEMLENTQHPLVDCRLTVGEVPDLARRVAAAEDEPFGGLPTLAYAKIFDRARAEGIVVLLDGQGIDEQWAGYDYYRGDANVRAAPVVQGTDQSPVRPACLRGDFAALAQRPAYPEPFTDRLRNLQYRDTFFTKLPRALRFNDRISMASSRELREPFLDHRLFELAFRQPASRKIRGETGKWLFRELTAQLLPQRLRTAPKRALQTPQREWLRGPLRGWANELIELGLASIGREWLDADATRSAWRTYCEDESITNSFWVWQWISLGLTQQVSA